MRREDDADALSAFDDVIVGDDVAVWINDDAGAEAALAADGRFRIVVAVFLIFVG